MSADLSTRNEVQHRLYERICFLVVGLIVGLAGLLALRGEVSIGEFLLFCGLAGLALWVMQAGRPAED